MSLLGFIVFIVVVGFALISSFSQKKMPENPNLKHNNSNQGQRPVTLSSSFDDLWSDMLKNSWNPKNNEECEHVWFDKTLVHEEPETGVKMEKEEFVPSVPEMKNEIKSTTEIKENKKAYKSVFDQPSNPKEWRNAIIMHEILKTKF